jgi:hypothetical protein
MTQMSDGRGERFRSKEELVISATIQPNTVSNISLEEKCTLFSQLHYGPVTLEKELGSLSSNYDSDLNALYRLKVKYRTVKVWLLVAICQDLDVLKELVRFSSGRAKLANSIISFYKKYALDGINFQLPDDSDSCDGGFLNQFFIFLKYLRKRANEQGTNINIALTFPTDWKELYNFELFLRDLNSDLRYVFTKHSTADSLLPFNSAMQESGIPSSKIISILPDHLVQFDMEKSVRTIIQMNCAGIGFTTVVDNFEVIFERLMLFHKNVTFTIDTELNRLQTNHYHVNRDSLSFGEEGYIPIPMRGDLELSTKPVKLHVQIEFQGDGYHVETTLI